MKSNLNLTWLAKHCYSWFISNVYWQYLLTIFSNVLISILVSILPLVYKIYFSFVCIYSIYNFLYSAFIDILLVILTSSNIRRSSQTGELMGDRRAVFGFALSSNFSSYKVNWISNYNSYIIDWVNLNIDWVGFS